MSGDVIRRPIIESGARSAPLSLFCLARSEYRRVRRGNGENRDGKIESYGTDLALTHCLHVVFESAKWPIFDPDGAKIPGIDAKTSFFLAPIGRPVGVGRWLSLPARIYRHGP